MIKLKKVLLSGLLVLTIGGLAVGCSDGKPEGEPVNAIESYYESIDNSEYDNAYEMLSKELKEDITKEQFSKWHDLVTEVSTDFESTFDPEEIKKDTELDGVTFPHATKVKVVKKSKNLYSNKTDSKPNEEYVVAEDDEWKIYRTKDDLNVERFISSNYLSLGWMYAEGKNVNLDANKAISMFNKSLEHHKSYSNYYALAYSLIDANRLDEALEAGNKALELIDKSIEEADDDADIDKNEITSNTQNLIGTIHQDKGEIEKAKEYFNSAIELDPSNEYAKTNLANLQ